MAGHVDNYLEQQSLSDMCNFVALSLVIDIVYILFYIRLDGFFT